MNYRHAFHAGNFADVFKHTILIGLLQALQAKPTPVCYVDTHAGAGRYDLAGSEAARTGEAREGVARLPANGDLPPPLQTYLHLLSSVNDGRNAEQTRIYPGSPVIAALLLRPGDRAALCEVQEDEAAALKALFASDDRVGVHRRDGYAALRALLPPKERRGLVLIDPPYETQDGEFRAIEAALENALVRWPTGVYAIWYPIKLREHTRAFQRWFVERRIPKVLLAELLRQRDDSPLRLNGCGMIVINAPWRFDQELRDLLPVLFRALARERAGGDWRVEWLTRD